MAYTYDPNASLAAKMAALEQLWTDAGGSAALAPQMAAVAIAESNGDPSGVCYDYVGADGKTHCSSTPNVAGATGQADVGLWGVANIHLPAGTPAAALTDPATNAAYAVKLAGPNGEGIANAWAADFSGAGLARYQAALAAAGASVTGAVQQFIVGDQMPGTTASTVYGQNLGGSNNAAANTPKAASTPTPAAAARTFWAPIIDAAQSIAGEVFIGAMALALLSGGILWLASTDSAVRATAVKAAAA